MCLIKIYTNGSVSDPSLYSRKYVYFVNLSTTTKILSYIEPLNGSFDLGSLIIKSIVTVY